MLRRMPQLFPCPKSVLFFPAFLFQHEGVGQDDGNPKRDKGERKEGGSVRNSTEWGWCR